MKAHTKQAIADIEEIAQRLKILRSRLPQDSPLHFVAFQVAALCGEMQAKIASDDKPDDTERP